MKRFWILSLLFAALVTAQPGPASAQDGDDGSNNIEDNLSSYTGANAQGYLKPLQTALGQTLNSGIFMYAGVPKEGFNARLDFRGMVTNFDDDDRTFMATTEDYFGDPPQTRVAPTVVGDGEAVSVTDPGTGATFYFPGGFDIKRFGLAVPQLTIGSVLGTQAMARYIAVETGDNEIGDVKLIGFGGRHSISAWMPNLPVDITGMVMWQKLEVGEDFLEAKTLTYGAQVGKTAGLVGLYGGVAFDSVDLDVTYTSDAGSDDPEEIHVEFDRETTVHLSLGATLKLGFVHLNGEYDHADQSSFAFGLGLGN